MAHIGYPHRQLTSVCVVLALAVAAASAAAAGGQHNVGEADSLRMLGEHGETLTSNRESRIVCDDDLNPTRHDDGRLSLVPEGDLVEQQFSQRRSNNNVVIGGSVLHRGRCQ